MNHLSKPVNTSDHVHCVKFLLIHIAALLYVIIGGKSSTHFLGIFSLEQLFVCIKTKTPKDTSNTLIFNFHRYFLIGYSLG